MKAALLLAWLAGCGGGDDGPSCAEVAGKMAAEGPIADAVAERCHVDAWPREIRRCLVDLGVRLDTGRCTRRLPPKDRNALGEAIEAARAKLVEKRPEPVAVEKKLELPSSGNGEIDPTRKSLVLEVKPDGVTVGGKVFTDAQLADIFRVAFAKDRQTQVVLRASPDIAHGRVVALMEMAKTAGLQRLSIGTAP